MEDNDNLDIFKLDGDEFKFLDYPNTFLSDKFNDDELNKSANTQLEENLKELIKVTSENKQEKHQFDHLNGAKTSYLDELNDLKELKRIEEKKSYQQSLDRLSKLNLRTGLSVPNNGNLINRGNKSSIDRDRRATFKFTKSDIQSLRIFKSNNHLPSKSPTVNIKVEPKFDSTFDLRNYDGEDINEKTFVVTNNLLNLSGDVANRPNDDYDVNNTFTVAKNYDDVQEIARKQEEALKKSKTTHSLPPTPLSINNATIVKAKKNGLTIQNKFDQTITLKQILNENLNDSIKSPNLDGTFNLGNPLENLSFNSPITSVHPLSNNGTIKKEKLPNSKILVLNQKNTTNVKRVLNNRNVNSNLEPKNNRLNSSFIVGEIQPKPQQTTDEKSDFNKTFQLPNYSSNVPSNQFSTKNKINKNLKRTNTFKVREFQFASEENLTFSKNGTHLLNQNFIVKNGLSVNNYQSIDDMKNYETIKLSQRKFNKVSSKSNGQINQNKNVESNENLNEYYKQTNKLPVFSSRLKAPSSRMSILKSEEI